MTVDDQTIGQNVAAARGAMSQQELANQMRLRGWKWSQSTVWAVERGDRPLRLAEASDLADVTGSVEGGAEQFLRNREQALFDAYGRKLIQATDDLADAVTQYLEAQELLAYAGEKDGVSDRERAVGAEIIKPGPVDVALSIEALSRMKKESVFWTAATRNFKANTLKPDSLWRVLIKARSERAASLERTSRKPNDTSEEASHGKHPETPEQ